MINNLRAFQEVLKRNNLPTPDTYLGISELIRSLYRPDVSPNPERIREVLEELTWPVTVPAGNPITFKSCSEVLASEAVVTFSPKQSGTGDPSPSNIRPFILWDGLSLAQSGSKNILDIEYIHLGVSYNGSAQSNRACMTLKVPYGIYTASISSMGALDTIAIGRSKMAYPITSSADYATTQLTSSTKKRTFTINEEYPYVYLTMITTNSITLSDCQSCYFMLEVGTTAHSYEAYNLYTIHTATFPDTVYGGSYDFVSGKGTSEWGYIAEYDGETITEPWLSSIDVYAPGTTPSTGAEVVYKLATPIEITLTPADVNLLKGSNTVWTDGDNVTVKFQTLK